MPLYLSNGKLLVKDGKLATSSNCCCDGDGFCCICLGPTYEYLEAPTTNGMSTCYRTFGNIFHLEYQGGPTIHSWTRIWMNYSTNQFWYTYKNQSQYVPPGYTHIYTICRSPAFRCEYVKALAEGSFPEYIINGSTDQASFAGIQFYTNWTKPPYSNRFNSCQKPMTKSECEKCTRIEDVLDLDIDNISKLNKLLDPCGGFTPNSPIAYCKTTITDYDPNNLTNCVETKECKDGIPYYNGSPGVPPNYNGCDICGTHYYIWGQITTLDCSGNGCWNNLSYWKGNTFAPPNFTGCDYCNNIYYINGTQTTLNCDGNGCWNNTYYINRAVTTLDCDGNGCWNNTIYYNGSVGVDPSFSGYSYCDGVYYIDGQATTLDSSGNGCWNNTIYYNGSVDPSFSGYNYCDGVYYIDGQATTLDSSGNGCWNNTIYYNGSVGVDPSFSGYSYCDGVYYIDGQATTLDSSGNGCWNGILYENGVNTGQEC